MADPQVRLWARSSDPGRTLEMLGPTPGRKRTKSLDEVGPVARPKAPQTWSSSDQTWPRPGPIRGQTSPDCVHADQAGSELDHIFGSRGRAIGSLALTVQRPATLAGSASTRPSIAPCWRLYAIRTAPTTHPSSCTPPEHSCRAPPHNTELCADLHAQSLPLKRGRMAPLPWVLRLRRLSLWPRLAFKPRLSFLRSPCTDAVEKGATRAASPRRTPSVLGVLRHNQSPVLPASRSGPASHSPTQANGTRCCDTPAPSWLPSKTCSPAMRAL